MPLVIPFLVFAAAIFLVGFSQTYTATHGSSSGKQAGGFSSYLTTILRGIGGLILGAANKIFRATVGHWAEAQLKPLARWFNGLNTLVLHQSAELKALAADTAAALERITGLHIRQAEKRAEAAARALIRPVEHDAAKALHGVSTLTHTVARFERTATSELHRVEHAVTVALPREIGTIRAGEKALERGYADLRDRTISLEDGAIKTWRWLNTHRGTAAFGVFAGAVAWALSHLGYGFLRCRSWQNLGRKIKCSDANVLEDLLIGATAVALSLSLVELAKAEQEVVGDLSTVVKDFWQA